MSHRDQRQATGRSFQGGILLVSLAVCLPLLPFGGCAGEPPLPSPPDLAALDPLVRSHLEAWIDRAREDRSAENLTDLALAYLANSLPAEADQVLALVARRTPDDPLPPLYRALAQARAGRPDESLETLRAVAARWPGFTPARARLGRALLEAGELEAAARAFREVVAGAPDQAAGYLGLAETQLQQGLPEDALATLATLPPAGAALPQRKLLTGQSLRALGRLEEATPLIASSQGAGRIDLPDAWSGRLELHARDLPHLVDRATGLVRLGRAGAAIELLQEIRRTHPDNYEVAVNLGVAYLHAGRAAEGRSLLESLIADQPRRFEGHLNLAAILLEQGALDAARAEAELAVDLAPGVAQARRTLAKIWERSGRPAEALEAYSAAVGIDPYDAVLQVELAKAALRAGDPARAEEACRRVSALEPESVTGPLCLGEALRRQEHHAEAEEALERARSLAPEHPDVAKLAARLAQGGAGGKGPRPQ